MRATSIALYPSALRALSALAVICVLAGCGASGELRGDRYRDEEASYRIGELGAGWERLNVDDQNDLAFLHREEGAIVQVNATCDPYQDTPLTSLTNHLLIGFTDREIDSQSLVPIDGREALRTHLLASLDGVQRELLLYVLKKDECVYDFALIARPGEPYSRVEPPFEAFVGAFRTSTGRGGGSSGGEAGR